MKKIGIIGAMKKEIDLLAEQMTEKNETVIGTITFYEGKLCDREVVLAVCGIGKVFAAMCAQTMIIKFGVDCIINSGVAGGLDDRLDICSAVIADKVVEHDMDTSPLGDPIGLISGINKVYLEADNGMIEALEKAISLYPEGYITGTVASGDQFIADPKKKEWLKEKFGAAACEMEGAAIAQVCYANNIPFAIFRTISDGANQMDYMTFAGIAAKRAQNVICDFLKTY